MFLCVFPYSHPVWRLWQQASLVIQSGGQDLAIVASALLQVILHRDLLPRKEGNKSE